MPGPLALDGGGAAGHARDMELLLAAGIVAVVLAAALLAGRRWARQPRPAARPWVTEEPAGARVVLDLRPEDPEDPAVQRLVDETARHCLDTDPELVRVRVVDRDGRELGVVHRPEPRPDVSLPDALHEPRRPRSRAPDPLGRRDHPHPPAPAGPDDQPAAAPHGTFADRLALDAEVRARLRDPDDPVELLRVLLELAGRRPEVHGDLLLVDDVAIAVVADRGRSIDDVLARAFLRIQQAGAPRGIILHLTWVDPATLRRREVAAPNVRHVGIEAVQRMADALRAGADPLDFVLGPALVR